MEEILRKNFEINNLRELVDEMYFEAMNLDINLESAEEEFKQYYNIDLVDDICSGKIEFEKFFKNKEKAKAILDTGSTKSMLSASLVPKEFVTQLSYTVTSRTAENRLMRITKELKLQPHIAQKILDFPDKLENLKQIQAFLGILNYSRKH